jgi:AcrR family transcriptional regulator
MSLKGEAGSKVDTRRRGEALEAALLDAAWAELTEHGYVGFGMDRVAKRASTSRAVLYRRWDDKYALVLDTLRWRRAQVAFVAPDTGSLRGDMLAMLDLAGEVGFDMVRMLTIGMAASVETGVPLAQFRADLLRDSTKRIRPILERAVARGEIDPARLTPRIATLPMDLLRHHALMTGEIPDAASMEEILDTIYLPLVGFAPEH